MRRNVALGLLVLIALVLVYHAVLAAEAAQRGLYGKYSCDYKLQAVLAGVGAAKLALAQDRPRDALAALDGGLSVARIKCGWTDAAVMKGAPIDPKIECGDVE